MKASIVISTFNGEKYIEECLNSIINQSEKNFEVIIINDGSTDNSAKIIKRFIEKDKRFTLHNKKNQGMGASLNFAVNLAKSNIIFRFDDDDIMESNRIERQLDFLNKNKDVSFSSSFYKLIDSDGKVIGKKRSELVNFEKVNKKINKDIVLGILHPGAVFYKNIFLHVGGYRPFFWPCEDIDLWSRFIEYGYKVKVQEEYLTKYRIHKKSISMKNFVNNTFQLKWVKECAKARRANKKEPNRDEFLKNYIPKNFFSKLNFYRKQKGKYFFYCSKNEYLKKSYFKFIMNILKTFIFRPKLVFNKIKIIRLVF